MKIAVFGAGGVGGYFGGRLAQAGQEVVFIARDHHLTALKTRGLRVDSVEGDFVLSQVEATDTPAAVGAVDVVILAVKAWQVKAAAKAMWPLLGANTFVLPLQNGVETATQLSEILGAERVIQGLCRIISQIEAPGHIVQTSPNPQIAFGEFDNQLTDRVEALRRVFATTKGITAEIPPNIQAAMWRKFLLVCSASGLGALTRMPLGIWRSIAETRRMWEQAIVEVLTVGQAHGVVIGSEVLAETREFIDGLSPLTTFSMQRDIMEGRPSELNSLCGAVVRFGLEVGRDTPMHNFIYYTLLPQELKARGQLGL